MNNQVSSFLGLLFFLMAACSIIIITVKIHKQNRVEATKSSNKNTVKPITRFIKKANNKYFSIGFAVLVISASILRLGIPLDFPARSISDEFWYIPQAMVIAHDRTNIIDDSFAFGHSAIEYTIPFIDRTPLWENLTYEEAQEIDSVEINGLLFPTSRLMQFGRFDHPPVGIFLIAGMMQFFDATDIAGGRMSSAVAGIILVAAVMLITKLTTKSNLASYLAGFFMLIDGHAIIMSRLGMLEILLTLFITLATLTSISAYRLRSNSTDFKWRLLMHFMTSIFLSIAVGVKWQAGIWAIIIAIYIFYKEYKITDKNKLLHSILTPVFIGISSLVFYIIPWYFTFINRGNFLKDLIDYHIFIWRVMINMGNTYPEFTLNSEVIISFPWSWIVQQSQFNLLIHDPNESVAVLRVHGNYIIWMLGFIAVSLLALILIAKILMKLQKLNLKKQLKILVNSVPEETLLFIFMFLAGILPWFFLGRGEPWMFINIHVLPWLAILLTILLRSFMKIIKNNTIKITLFITFILVALVPTVIFFENWALIPTILY